MKALGAVISSHIFAFSKDIKQKNNNIKHVFDWKTKRRKSDSSHSVCV